MRRLNILTWHIHGSYLYYLTQAPHEFYLPSKKTLQNGYLGKYGHLPWGDNVHDVPVETLKKHSFDCILFQRRDHYLKDQYEILSPEQQRLPKIFLEHEPPPEDPTRTHHVVDDPNMLLVHVTPYNDLMWDSGRTPTRVIEHGVLLREEVRYHGTLAKGLVVINHLKRRGRQLGADLFEAVRSLVPLDLIGMAAEEAGGLGEVIHKDISMFESAYRFFFSPIRYASLALATVEAMMIGMPIVGLATTEMATVIQNGVSGFVDTSVPRLVDRMEELLKNPSEAKRLGDGAKRAAQERFNIYRFVQDWNEAFAAVC